MNDAICYLKLYWNICQTQSLLVLMEQKLAVCSGGRASLAYLFTLAEIITLLMNQHWRYTLTLNITLFFVHTDWFKNLSQLLKTLRSQALLSEKQIQRMKNEQKVCCPIHLVQQPKLKTCFMTLLSTHRTDGLGVNWTLSTVHLHLRPWSPLCVPPNRAGRQWQPGTVLPGADSSGPMQLSWRPGRDPRSHWIHRSLPSLQRHPWGRWARVREDGRKKFEPKLDGKKKIFTSKILY